MSKKKKTEPKPTPPAADITVDKSDFLAHADSPVERTFVLADEFTRIAGPCPICGTVTGANVCPVDGHNFEVTK